MFLLWMDRENHRGGGGLSLLDMESGLGMVSTRMSPSPCR